MSAFDSIKLEVYIGSSWIDLTPDVVGTIVGRIGMDSSTFMARVSDPGTLKFQLNNSSSNSQGRAGLYSPQHANKLSGWTTNLPVMLTFLYDGHEQKFLFYIAPDGIEIDAGTSGTQRVTVICEDWMGYASRQIPSPLQSQSNKTTIDAIQTLMGLLERQPSSFAYGTPLTTFPTVFDVSSSETTILGEFNRLAMSDWGKIFTERDPLYGLRLCFQDRSGGITFPYQRNFPKHSSECGSLLLTSGDKLLNTDNGRIVLNEQITIIAIPDTWYYQERPPRIVHGGVMVNQINILSYPRKVGTSDVVLWKMQSSTKLNPGQTISGIRGRYRDPNGQSENINGTDFITPVANTDYKAFANADGTGADLTANLSVTIEFGAAEFEMSLTNTGGTTLYTGKDILFQVRGKTVTVYDKTEKVERDTSSIASYGKQEFTFDLKYENNIENHSKLANALLLNFAAPKTFMENVWMTANRNHETMVLFLYAMIGDNYPFRETMSNANASYFINGIEFEIVGSIVYFKYTLSPYFTVVDF
ncbi:MAG: hypothetical protein ACOY4M_08330 [Pseudomonadota bacterium]